MRTTFLGYYPPTDAEYERLWKEAMIVLDTNVLLNLYRLPTTARNELLEVLDTLKDRLWIPHQVALEFHRRRLTVIAAERKSTEEALETARELVNDIKRKVDGLQIDKRGIGIEPKPLLEDLEQANEKLIDAVKSVHQQQFDISASDPVREKIDQLLEGKVGAGPISQDELDKLVEGGEDRYKERIPPGFADADKEKNPNEATFVHDHLKYQRKFGDLVLWKQLIQHAKNKKIKAVLLVTADKKDDWWWREQGKTIGPHPELVREIMREAEVDLYWMYSSVQFVEHATKYTAANVSSQSVDELKQVASAPHTFESGRDVISSEAMYWGRQIPEPYLERPDPRFLEDSVEDWLRYRYEDVTRNSRGFPDFIVSDNGVGHGYEVKFIRNIERLLFSPVTINAMLRGYLETREGRLSKFTLIAIVTESDFFELINSDREYNLKQQLSRLLEKYPISEIILGSILNGRFEPLIVQEGDFFSSKQLY